MVILGLGTNCGDRLGYLRKALHALRGSERFRSVLSVKAISPLYESDAMLQEGADPSWNQPFLNLAVLAETRLPAPELLERVKGLEHDLGRVTRGRWAPREIDIDILLLGDQTVELENLRVPHPGLLSRPFALLP